MGTMGRKRQSNFSLPPRMHMKGDTYYYVTNTNPRKWIKLGKDLSAAKVQWAKLEGNGAGAGTFAKALDEWMSGPKYQALAANSKIAYDKCHEPLKAFFEGFDLGEIQPKHIAEWLDNHPSPVLANIGRAIVSNVMEQAVRSGVITRNPCRDISGLTIKSRTRYMTDAEFLAIREQACDVVKVCMDIGYLTGLRISDILTLKFSDIQDDGLYIIQHKTGSKQRYTITPALLAVIETAKALPRSVRNITHLLCTRQGEPYSYGKMNRLFVKAKEAAKVEGVRFHDIRAKSATDAKAQGLDYQALLGHASQAMSEKYIRGIEFKKVQPLKKVL